MDGLLAFVFMREIRDCRRRVWIVVAMVTGRAGTSCRDIACKAIRRLLPGAGGLLAAAFARAAAGMPILRAFA